MTIRDGQEFVHHERINRGADERVLSEAEIVEKFLENMALVTTGDAASAVRDLVLGLDSMMAGELARGLAV